MPIIAYLKHPLHGEKHAYTPQEVEEDKKNGWEEFTPGGSSVPDFLSVVAAPEAKAKAKAKPTDVATLLGAQEPST